MNRLSEGPPLRSRRRLVRQVVRGGVGIVVAGVALQAVFGRRDELAGAFSILEHLRVGWVAVALVAELASIAAYAALQRRLLASGGLALSMGSLTAVTLAANAIQNSLPAGPAWSNAYSYRQFRRRGADAVLALWALVISSILASATLAAIALLGLGVAQGQASSLDLGRVILAVTVVGVGLVVALRTGLAGRQARYVAVWVVRACQRLVRRPAGHPADLVASAWNRLRSVHLSWRTVLWATLYALANWLLDLAALGLAFVAVRAPVPWRGLLLAYGAGQLAANLPVTLGGLGVVEGSLTVALVFYGGAQVTTVAAVLLYRILSFWLMLPLGWASALFLRLGSSHSDSLEVLPAVQG
ncbi:MAG: hypothetical protein NVSMB32_07840 [Actinomycetota bacterium]